MIKTRSLSNSSFTQKDSYYGPNGNLVRKEMANGLTVDYNYNDLNLLTEEVKVRDGDVIMGTRHLDISIDALNSLHFDYTKLNQIAREIRVTEGNIYTTEYGYDFVGNLTGMKYPESNEWVTYQYNELDQLKNISREVEGVKTNILNNLDYDLAGNLIAMNYNNNI